MYVILHVVVEMCFLFSGCTAVAEVLINAGADVNARGYNGNTPLILAANGGHAGVARLLLNHPNISIHDQVSSSGTNIAFTVLFFIGELPTV